MKIHLVITGRAYHQAAGLPDELELPTEAKLADALAKVDELLGTEQLPPTCLISVAGTHVGMVANHGNPTLSDGDELALISPVAGG